MNICKDPNKVFVETLKLVYTKFNPTLSAVFVTLIYVTYLGNLSNLGREDYDSKL